MITSILNSATRVINIFLHSGVFCIVVFFCGVVFLHVGVFLHNVIFLQCFSAWYYFSTVFVFYGISFSTK